MSRLQGVVDERRLDELLGLVRASGGRVTTPRRAILAALLESGPHVTADELAKYVQARYPDVHMSTIYRTLETLTDLGVIDHVHLGHGRAVFHMADEMHEHLVCAQCGAVVEAPSEVFTDLARRIEDDYGFALDRGHFALSGMCSSCRRQADKATGRPDGR
jgi:Fur family ferric uptake transcriptional regulator